MSEVPFQSLFQPIQIGPVRLKNRIVMPPMGTNFGDPEYPGFVSERHKVYYTERARGGAALIMLEGANVNPVRLQRKCGLAIYSDQFISGLKELVGMIKGSGARCGMQISSGGGRLGMMKVDSGGKPLLSSSEDDDYLAASPVPHPVTGLVPKEFSQEQLKEIVGYFAEAAKRIKRVGLDVIMIHGAHGYLLNEFLSSRTNKRTDPYGGNIEGRSRFPLEVVKAVKAEIGEDIVLSYRMSVLEFVEGGMDLSDSILFAKKLEETGVQIIDISGGVNESPWALNRAIPPMSFPRGRLVPYAERIKKEVKIPVCVVQRINTPELADEVIREGKADLVATGRALIADPFWPLKAKEGRVDEIRRCIACNQGCMENVVMERSMTCLYNPEVGYEDLYRLGKKTIRRKKVLVVGGGVAGMEAAYVCANRGHQVVLIEKENELGGSASLAPVLDEKKEFGGVVEFLQNQLRRLNVEVRLQEEVNVQSAKEAGFEEILVATGSVPIMPVMNLREKKYGIRLAKDVFKNPEGMGKDIVVLGGGAVGMDVALYLYQLGKNVTVIEMLDRLGADLGPLNRVDAAERVGRSTIQIMLETKVVKLRDEGITLSKRGKEEILKPPDTVIIAMGAKPNPHPPEAIGGRIHYIGDCQKVGNAMDAIHDAFDIAMKV